LRRFLFSELSFLKKGSGEALQFPNN